MKATLGFDDQRRWQAPSLRQWLRIGRRTSRAIWGPVTCSLPLLRLVAERVRARMRGIDRPKAADGKPGAVTSDRNKCSRPPAALRGEAAHAGADA